MTSHYYSQDSDSVYPSETTQKSKCCKRSKVLVSCLLTYLVNILVISGIFYISFANQIILIILTYASCIEHNRWMEDRYGGKYVMSIKTWELQKWSFILFNYVNPSCTCTGRQVNMNVIHVKYGVTMFVIHECNSMINLMLDSIIQNQEILVQPLVKIK